jgi:phosphoglycolate phosphatase
VAIRVALFDIDGTLVLTGGAGARAMFHAFERVFGPRDPRIEVPFAGRTDTWIIGQLARGHGFGCDAATLARFREIYLADLVEELQHPGPRKGILPGVRAVLDRLQLRSDVHLGLLTGNFRDGARLKLEYFDLWRYFPSGAFAEDAEDRNSLFGHAVERLGLASLAPEEVVIIGDTPLDVEVARSAGARSLGVATGTYDEAALLSAGADVVLANLEDVERALLAMGVPG